MTPKHFHTATDIAADRSIRVGSSQQTCQVIAHSAQVIKAAMSIEAELDKVLDWFETDAINELGETAMHLVLEGRHADVLAFLERVARDMATDTASAQRDFSHQSRRHAPARMQRIYAIHPERNATLPHSETMAFG